MKRLPANLPQGFHFDEATHNYFFDGKPMMGCTTVLGVIAKPALIQWAAKMAVEHIRASLKLGQGQYAYHIQQHELDELLEQARTAHAKKRDKAADDGTDLHAEVEMLVKHVIETSGGNIPEGYACSNEKVQAFADWARKEGVRFIASEQRLYSKSLWVAGTCDLIFEKDGKRYVGDIKTYKKIWDRVPIIQCAGYALMWEEMKAREMYGDEWAMRAIREPIDGYCVICLTKERAFNEAEDVLWSWDTEGDREAFLAAVKLYKYLKQK